MLVHYEDTTVSRSALTAIISLADQVRTSTTLRASAALIATIDRLAARDGIAHADLLARAVEAYKLFPTLGPSATDRLHRVTFFASTALIGEIAALIAIDRRDRAEFLHRAVEAFQAMYPGPDYRPAA